MTQLSTVKSDFEAYKNNLGFYSNNPSGSTGNDLLISAECKRVLTSYGLWEQADQDALNTAITKYSQIVPGLYQRPGWSQDQEQPDDYYGLGYCDQKVADNINHYGKHLFWYFKTSSAAKWYEPMFWRWPALMAHIKWSAGLTPNLFLRLWWCLSVAFTGSDEDGYKINRTMIEVAGNKGWMERWATEGFWKRLGNSYGSMKNVYRAYYGENHPLSKWATD